MNFIVEALQIFLAALNLTGLITGFIVSVLLADLLDIFLSVFRRR